MKRCYLVAYDIHEPRRLHKVFQILKGYGEHWQLSVFFCYLKEIDKVRMQGQLNEVVNHAEDQILVFDMGIDEKKARDNTLVIGQPLLPQNEHLLIV